MAVKFNKFGVWKMKLKSLITVSCMLSIVCFAHATMAQEGVPDGPAVLVENAVASTADATVNVSVQFVEGTTPELAVAQFDILYDPARFTPTMPANCDQPADPDWLCTIFAPGTMRWQADPDFNVEDYPSTDVVFTILNNEEGTFPLTVSNQVYGDAGATPVPPNGTMDGSIQIVGPSYASNPVPGPIDLGTVTQFDTDPMANLDISNDGAVGTTLTGSCSLSGPQAGTFSLSPDNTFSVLQGAAADTTTITCDSAQAVMTHNATLSCIHDGDDMPASPVNYALTCTINAGPSPEYGSTPGPGSTIEFGTFTTTDPAADEMVTIENVGNADGLDGACSITNNPNGAYSVDTGANYGPLAQMATAMRTVTCDTSILGDHDGGVLSCTHNGSAIASPATYTLNCEVTPTPQYTSNPAAGNPLPVLSGDQGDTDPTTVVSISNSGEAGSTLTGTCSLTGPDDELYIDGGGGFSVLQGDPAAQITVACDASAAGPYSNTLSCTHNDGDGDPSSPVTYAVACEIGPPDPAIYDSTPAPGAIIDLTPGDPVPEGTDLTDAAQLAIRNAADPGDDFLDLMGCAISAGSTEITASPTPVDNDIDVGDPDVIVNFSCDTTVAGSYSATYTCPFDENPSAPVEGGVVSPAEYTVTCDVREPFSEVVETPASGTPQTAEVGPGESHTFSFLFEEVLDEGLDATLDDCSLASGTDFAITSPVSFPQTIPSGGSVQVDVQFTDPGTGDTFTDTLNCTYTDNQDGGEPEQTPVSWPLEVNVTGRNVRFRVTKDFSDDNPLGVEVLLECNTGLPLQQQGTVHDPDAVGLGPGDFTHLDFVVVDFEPGTMDCDVSEEVPAGYAPSYFADIGEDGVAGGVSADDDGCHYEALESADFICEISNELLPVTVTVNKEWVDDNPSFNLPTFVEVTLHCNAPVVFLIEPGPAGGDQLNGGNGFSVDQFIDPSNPGIFGVFPHWDGTTECFVTEEVDAGVLPDLTDCESIPLAPGVDGECTIVNTRLFAGIPTLSQYGLILMALLMLGVGALGFRRYA